MPVLYDFSIRLYTLGIRAASLWLPKARLWLEGRRDWRRRYDSAFQKRGKTLWMHVASLGEFEQGRPVIEAFRAAYPDWQIVLSFFSPSGYEIRKNYPHVDWVCYLPADTRSNARDFLAMVQPDLAVFVKYDFWYHYLRTLQQNKVPTCLISALFRPGQPFFQPYGALWRGMLRCFTHIFVQNESSLQLLQSIGISDASAAGDNRVDRVAALAAGAPSNTIVEHFAGQNPVLIAGSSWPADEDAFLPVLQSAEFQHYKLIVAPHDPSEKHLAALEKRLHGPYIRYSKALNDPEGLRQATTLLIDNVGMLNALYRYAAIVYIGGGFGKGIHNTLEPAAYGRPILFGPNYRRFEEARYMVAAGGAFCIRDAAELKAVLQRLAEPAAYDAAVAAVSTYIKANSGATDVVMRYFTAMISPP